MRVVEHSANPAAIADSKNPSARLGKRPAMPKVRLETLPDRLYVREQRDVDDMDCHWFTTKLLPLGDSADCQTDGHYLCRECVRRDPDNDIDAGRY